ncbi:rhythmically expressed gene 2 protein [Anthonomus grandis grandis]|uniref:rhythmically expressed gene 2 protein n=1 Tax=Anthonomus grandis grandis TaxID=2921223 RepID=UPI0021659D0A|nr:rhythmically expressed gene 2 protein [Anthonomus grandis grandis]
MNLSKIRLVTFDVTGTLLKLRTAPGQQYGEIGAMYGLVADGHILSRNFKDQWRRMNKEHPNFGLNSGLGWENWWKTVVKETFKSSKFKIEEDKVEKVASHLLEMYKTSACWQHCYGVPGLLSYIRSKNIPMGVISNFDPRLHAILVNTKLKHYFQFVLTSYETGIEKPDPRIFDLALKSVPANIKPEECLHIGDKPLLDYKAARNCGWNSFLLSETEIPKLKQKLEDLDENHCFGSAYQLHVNLLKKSGDKLPTPEQELN